MRFPAGKTGRENKLFGRFFGRRVLCGRFGRGVGGGFFFGLFRRSFSSSTKLKNHPSNCRSQFTCFRLCALCGLIFLYYLIFTKPFFLNYKTDIKTILYHLQNKKNKNKFKCIPLVDEKKIIKDISTTENLRKYPMLFDVRLTKFAVPVRFQLAMYAAFST